MTISSAELAQRLVEADRHVVLLRQATLEMQAVRAYLLAERRRDAVGRRTRS